jgi:cytoskeletal protein RodZ
MSMRYNPPPNWPPPPAGWTPPPGRQPDPAWGPAPAGWRVWVDDETRRSWFGRHKVLTVLGAIVGAFFCLGIIGSIFGTDSPETTTTASASTSSADTSSPEETGQRTPTPTETDTPDSVETASEEPAAETSDPAPAKPRLNKADYETLGPAASRSW